jgi:uncharacterized membrane protein YphA (DoxX/SURF4 family)
MTLFGVAGPAWALLFARLVLGLIFGMAGWGKIFKMTPAGHAHRYFLDPYADTWIPTWLLWTFGLSIPFVEFAAGWLIVAGVWVGPSLVALGVILAIVTYGHLLKNHLYEFHTHVIPRLALVLFLLVMPRAADALALEHWWGAVR